MNKHRPNYNNDWKEAWKRRKENFDVTHQIEYEKDYKQIRFCFLVTGNRKNWSAITVLGIDELLTLQKEINKVAEKARTFKSTKPKRVLKRRKK